MKNIVILFDGTGTTSTNNSNVWKIADLCLKDDKSIQIVDYHQGVGTRSTWDISGLIFGASLDDIIYKAYVTFSKNYERGDKIFLFGFSRGAFQARILASIICRIGIVANISQDKLFAIYKQTKVDSETANGIPVEYLGVYDTVGRYKVNGMLHDTWADSFFDFVWKYDGKVNFRDLIPLPHSKVRAAKHALALDEPRWVMKPLIWNTNGANGDDDFSHVEQRWFIGAHAGIGGDKDYSKLQLLAFHYILKGATDVGLLIDESRLPKIEANTYLQTIDSPLKPQHFGAFNPLKESRVVNSDDKNVNECIDSTVFKRIKNDSTYKPVPLKKFKKIVKEKIKQDNPTTYYFKSKL